MEKLFFYDLETTGVMHWKNGIHQIAGQIVIDGVIKEVFDFKVAPNPAAIITPEALEVGGVTIEQIQTYPPMREVYNSLIKMMSKYVDRYSKFDKFHLVGYNNRGFDDNFLRALCKTKQQKEQLEDFLSQDSTYTTCSTCKTTLKGNIIII